MRVCPELAKKPKRKAEGEKQITSVFDFRQPGNKHLEVRIDAGLYLIPLFEQMFEANRHLWINISEQSA